jgi:hypothetical protein
MIILGKEIPDWIVYTGLGFLFWQVLKRRDEGPQNLAAQGPMEGQVMTCAAWQKVMDSKGKEIIRCMYYEPACTSDKCLDIPAEYPKSYRKESPSRIREEEKMGEREAKAQAQWMAQVENEALKEGREFYRRILAHGGIAPYKGGHEAEEYHGLPNYIKRKTGFPLDEMATELGFKDEAEFVEAIHKEQERREKLPKGRSYYRIKDFLGEFDTWV